MSSERDEVAGVGHAVQSNKQRGLSATFKGAKQFERVAAGIGSRFLRDSLMHRVFAVQAVHLVPFTVDEKSLVILLEHGNR